MPEFPDCQSHELGRWGPFIVERTASGDKIGYVMTVRVDGMPNRYVELRTSPKGQSGIQVHNVLFSSRLAEDA